MFKSQDKKYLDDLLNALQIAAKDKRLLNEFLAALLTPTEFEEIAKRIQIVKRLKEGNTQRKIASELEVGVATINRGVRELQDPNNGFHKVINKFK
jgi:TrpR family trp operon transcriptional repressor